MRISSAEKLFQSPSEVSDVLSFSLACSINASLFQSPSEVSDVLSVSRKNTLNKLLKAAFFSPPSSNFQKIVFRRFFMSLRSHTALSLPFFHPSIPAYCSTTSCNPGIERTKDNRTDAEEGPGENTASKAKYVRPYRHTLRHHTTQIMPFPGKSRWHNETFTIK